MTEKAKPTFTQPGGLQEHKPKPDDGVENDSLGTEDPADSTGLGEEKETEDASAVPRRSEGS